VVSSCEHGNEHSGSLQCEESLDQLRNFYEQFIQEDSGICSQIREFALEIQEIN
jgi:hypothetical protein